MALTKSELNSVGYGLDGNGNIVNKDGQVMNGHTRKTKAGREVDKVSFKVDGKSRETGKGRAEAILGGKIPEGMEDKVVVNDGQVKERGAFFSGLGKAFGRKKK